MSFLLKASCTVNSSSVFGSTITTRLLRIAGGDEGTEDGLWGSEDTDVVDILLPLLLFFFDFLDEVVTLVWDSDKKKLCVSLYVLS